MTHDDLTKLAYMQGTKLEEIDKTVEHLTTSTSQLLKLVASIIEKLDNIAGLAPLQDAKSCAGNDLLLAGRELLAERLKVANNRIKDLELVVKDIPIRCDSIELEAASAGTARLFKGLSIIAAALTLVVSYLYTDIAYAITLATKLDKQVSVIESKLSHHAK